MYFLQYCSFLRLVVSRRRFQTFMLNIFSLVKDALSPNWVCAVYYQRPFSHVHATPTAIFTCPWLNPKSEADS